MFIPVSGCVGRGPIALLCPGAYTAVKRALGSIPSRIKPKTIKSAFAASLFSICNIWE